MRIEIDEASGGVFVEKYDVGVFLSWRDIRVLERVRKEECLAGKEKKRKR